MHEINALWIPIVGILMPLALVPMIMILKHRTLQREWQHKERMKAVEMGVPPPCHTAGGSVVAVGAGVPIASVIGAAVTSLSYQPSATGDEMAVFGIAWGCALMIGSWEWSAACSSLTCTLGREKRPNRYTRWDNGKPIFDPDAYDVVSSRG